MEILSVYTLAHTVGKTDVTVNMSEFEHNVETDIKILAKFSEL